MSIRDPSPTSTLHHSTRSDFSEKPSLEMARVPAPAGYSSAGAEIRPTDSRISRRSEKGIATLGEGPSAPDAVDEAVKCDLTENGDEQPPPQTTPGTKGWLDLLGAVMVNTICYGMTNSYGVFQEYYSTHELAANTATQISWIGSIQLCLCPLLGCISGPLFDAGYLKSLVATGGFIYVFSLMMASISTQYYQLLLSHGLGVGLGMGLIFSPSVSTLSHHFANTRYRTLAYGCQAAGSAGMGIIIPIGLRYLFPAVGFGWTMRIVGFMVMLWVIGAFFFLSRVHPPRKELALLSPVVFRNTPYTFYVLGVSCISLAIYCPLIFGVTYATSHGLSVSLANYALAIANGGSIFGRVLPLIVATRVGPLNVLLTFALTSSIMLFCWTKAEGVAGIITYDLLYGISSGAYAASMNPGAAAFAPHPNQSGLYLGMCFFTNSWFWLAGTPATAALIRGKTDYFPASMFSAAAILFGAGLCFISRWLWVKRVKTKWV